MCAACVDTLRRFSVIIDNPSCFFFIPLLKTHTPQSEPASICPDNYHKITKQTNYVRVNYIYKKKEQRKLFTFIKI